MYYEKDIESIGGLFIKERVLEKKFRYEIIRCLLYVGGEKFQVVLQEFKQGKGVVLDVIAENREEQLEKREKLDFIIEKYSRNENAPIKYYQRERADIKMKTSILLGMDIILIFNALDSISEVLRKGLAFTRKGVTAGIVFVVGVVLLFIISNLRSRYIRG